MVQEGCNYCTREHKVFYPLSLPSGAWSTAIIEVATRPQIVCKSSSSHDKIKNNAFCFALCLT